ncbi:hypothetical protein BDR03DRAFT_943277 [Suillus americanus]|nr:hypothetical protein BDR03DRAFT_943277 [Suillus americanus]
MNTMSMYNTIFDDRSTRHFRYMYAILPSRASRDFLPSTTYTYFISIPFLIVNYYYLTASVTLLAFLLSLTSMPKHYVRFPHSLTA